MSLTLQEAVAGLQSDGPSVNDKLQQMTNETRRVEANVHQYEGSLKALQNGIAEQHALLLEAGQALHDMLAECQQHLENEIRQTDQVADSLSLFVTQSQAELTAQMQVARTKLQELGAQLDTLPPVLQQAVVKQEEVLTESRRKVDVSMGNIKNTVDKAVREYEALKTDVQRQQGVVKSHVETLVSEVKKVQTQAEVDSKMLAHNSAKVVETFQLNLQEGLKTSISTPAQQMQAGIDQLKAMAEEQIDQRLTELIDQILGSLLRAVDKMVEKNESMVNTLRRYIPDQLIRAADNLGWVIANLDQILVALAEGAVNWVVDWLKKGLDFVSKVTGLKTDFLQNGLDALGNLVKTAVRVSVAPMTLARTLVTNPGNIWNEAQAIVTGSRSQASSLGRQVRG